MRYLLLLVSLLGALTVAPVAHATCVPTETTESRIVLQWPALAPTADYTLTAWRLQRDGDHPAILPPLAPDALTMTDTVQPGFHAWQLKAEFVRATTGKTHLSDLAPLGDPPPCMVVLATSPPPPTLTSLVPTTTMSGAPGLHLRWTLAGPDRPVRIERRSDATQPWGHVGSAPGGFWFDLFALEPGTTYCYRACLLHTEAPTCSAERCAVFPVVP